MQNTMTFSERVKARWRAPITAFIVGLAVAEVLVWVLLAFVVFVALSAAGIAVPVEMRRMILIINQITVLATAFCMWIARGIQLSADVNTIIGTASPLQKQLLGTQLTEEAQAESALVKVERLIAEEAVPVIDLVGGPAGSQP